MAEGIFCEQLKNEIVARNPLQGKFLNESFLLLSEHERQLLEKYIRFWTEAQKESVEFLVESYEYLVNDSLSEQMYFKKNNSYRYTRFEEVASSVYFHDGNMKKYMVGLALSVFLWPNHLEILRYFQQKLPQKSLGSYLEVGPGHGFFFKHALENSSFTSFLGLDLSPTSVEMTRRILDYSKVEKTQQPYQVVEQDFLKWETKEHFSAIVVGEVLEHVERPQDFLEKIVALTNENSFIFVTTCLNAPQTDHIYLYRDISEVEAQVKSVGLEIQDCRLLPSYGKSMEQAKKLQIPVNVAMVLKNRFST